MKCNVSCDEVLEVPSSLSLAMGQKLTKLSYDNDNLLYCAHSCGKLLGETDFQEKAVEYKFAFSEIFCLQYLSNILLFSKAQLFPNIFPKATHLLAEIVCCVLFHTQF